VIKHGVRVRWGDQGHEPLDELLWRKQELGGAVGPSPQIKAAQRLTARDVAQYRALSDKVFEEAREGLAVIESGNIKAWERRSSATRGWMGMATPFLAAGIAAALGCLLTLVLAGRRLWVRVRVRVRVRVDDAGVGVGGVQVPWEQLQGAVLGPESMRLELRDGSVRTGPGLELPERDQAAFDEAVGRGLGEALEAEAALTGARVSNRDQP
jgi:hypothetical protein